MTPEELVSAIKSSILDESLSSYKKMFETSNPNDPKITSPYWKEALALFADLNPQQRSTLYKIIAEVQKGTAARLFATLDGITVIKGVKKDFVLTFEGETEQLNGPLSDSFLQLFEE